MHIFVKGTDPSEKYPPLTTNIYKQNEDSLLAVSQEMLRIQTNG